MIEFFKNITDFELALSALVSIVGLLLASFIVIILFLNRWFYFVKINPKISKLEGIQQSVANNQVEEAIKNAAKLPVPLRQVVLQVVSYHDWSRVDLCSLVDEYYELLMPQLRSKLVGFVAITMVAPLWGLCLFLLEFKNRFGLQVQEISLLLESNQEGINYLRQGLQNCIWSLVISIAAYLAYLYFSNQALLMRVKLQGLTLDVVNTIHQKNHKKS